MEIPSIAEMLEAGVHFGHQKQRLDPRAKKFIFTIKDNTAIIDLDKTYEQLGQACNFLEELVKTRKTVLFVGTKKQAKTIVQRAAQDCRMPYIVNRWFGGTLTNFSTIKHNIKKLHDLIDKRKQGVFLEYTKKEQMDIDEEIDKLNENFGGIKDMTKIPDAVIIFDIIKDAVAVKEARRLGIPLIGLVDANANPEICEYPIPANDDAISSIQLFAETFSKVISENIQEKKVIEEKKESKKPVKKTAKKEKKNESKK